MKLKIIFLVLFFVCFINVVTAGDNEDWEPISIKANDVIGDYNWTINWDLSFHYTKFDQNNADGSGLFINRQIDKKSYLPAIPLITRDSLGIDETPDGTAVSMASMRPSKRVSNSGGELYQNDGKTAHQRDWDALVAARDKVFKENNVTEKTTLLEKAKIIAYWAREVNRGGPVYESKHPADLIFHPSFCVGRANAFVGIMHTMGLPARTINMNTHSVAEVLINGRWYYAENINGRKTDTKEIAPMMPCSLMEFYADPSKYKDFTSESHVASAYFTKKDLHNGRANWQLGAHWKWHFIQCAKGDDVMMRHTLENGSGIAVSLNSANSAALYPKADTYYFKVLKGNPPVMHNYQKNSWYYAGHRVLQGDWIRKRFYIGNLDDADNPVTKVVSRLYLRGGETQSFAIPPVTNKEYAEWTLKINDKSYKLKDWKNWKLVKEFEPVVMMPVIYFEFEIDKKDLKQNDYNIFSFGSTLKNKRYTQHIYVMIFPDPIKPYINPHKPAQNERIQREWDVITDQKWDLLQLFEYAR